MKRMDECSVEETAEEWLRELYKWWQSRRGVANAMGFMKGGVASIVLLTLFF